jgi:3-keto-5-aminohexanoate cleavage enzyme
MSSTPLIVICAPNGARIGKTEHDSVPLTAPELADCAESLVDCGVSVLHLHVRDNSGRHTLDAQRYREALASIRERVGDRLILQVTTEAVGLYNRQQQMALVRELRPEAVSLALRELCPDPESVAEASRFFHAIRRAGCWPQYILYSPAEVARFEAMRKDGVFGEDRPFALFVLGRYSDSLTGEPAELDGFLEACQPVEFPWAVCCFGPHEAAAISRAATLGGHARIGFENNRVLPDGEIAANNAELVSSAIAAYAAANAPPRPLATADWVRKHLAGTAGG